VEGNESSRERKFRSMELSFLGAKFPGNESSMERKFHGTFVPGSESSLERKFQHSYKMTVRLHLEYANQVWFPQRDLDRIEKVQKHSNFHRKLRKTHVLRNVVHNGFQGHPRSLILAPIESAYATAY